ncbi:MAG: DUF4416 family protein [Deltaproteobacteria bacterium]|nr:DUF4416 family protein [Deltaproteobacteria bacterium]
MSDPQPPEAVKLIASLLSGDDSLLGDAVRALSEKYGKADFISAPMPFTYTDYYAAELGSDLIRRFMAFERPIRPETMPDVKLWTNALEKRLSVDGRRRVNIDPGYLAKAHLILATGKGYTHRPCLREGIYADLTLIYREKAFHPLPWTYPDYAGEEIMGMLNRIREKYLLQLKGRAAGSAPAADGIPDSSPLPSEEFE